MLGMKLYPKQFIDDCRAKIDADVAAFSAIPGPVPEASETSYFNNLVLVLDYLFVHRLRTMEGKDGNPLNEVRILCNSILHNKCVMTVDNVSDTTAYAGLNTIKLSPAKTVLKYEAGQTIAIKRADFELLASAFFDEMELRFL